MTRLWWSKASSAAIKSNFTIRGPIRWLQQQKELYSTLAWRGCKLLYNQSQVSTNFSLKICVKSAQRLFDTTILGSAPNWSRSKIRFQQPYVYISIQSNHTLERVLHNGKHESCWLEDSQQHLLVCQHINPTQDQCRIGIWQVVKSCAFWLSPQQRSSSPKITQSLAKQLAGYGSWAVLLQQLTYPITSSKHSLQRDVT